MLTNDEARHLGVSLMLQATERDSQERIGASDMANPCDRCLAASMSGVKIRSITDERWWLPRVIGTAMSMLMEERAPKNTDYHLLPEEHVYFADLAGYGKVGGSIDLLIPDERHLMDWKGEYRWRIALLEDLFRSYGMWRVDEEPRWEKQKDTAKYEGGYKYKPDSRTVVSLSARHYAEEIEHMKFKLEKYHGQLSLYMRSGVAGAATLFFFARDGHGGFDTPALEGYIDPKRKHDTFCHTFLYDEEAADALVARAERTWAALESGATYADFEGHAQCFTCSKAQEDNTVADVIAIFEEGKAA